MKHFTINTLDHNTAVNKDESILEAKIIYSNLCPLADLWRHHMNDPQVPEKWSPEHRLCFLLLLNVEIWQLFSAEPDLFCEPEGCWPPQKNP